MSHELDIIGLFPSFESKGFGGVQASGREAWQGIVRGTGERRASALHYEPGSSKAGAVLQAIRNRKSARVVLVWHLHLLKLLPFLDHSTSRVVLFLHGVEAWLKQDAVTRMMLKKARVILSNSDYTWNRFLASNTEFRNTEHHTVHLGVGSGFAAPTPAPSGIPVVLMVGRLNQSENYKGHQQMIEAWPRVLDRVPGAQLWIVGDGDLRPKLEAMPGRDSIRFFGQVSDAEKERLIAQCRCLALPSSGEGFGLVYLEAMRVGRPCLVSTLDAGREVVNPPEAGLAIDVGNPLQVADALERLLTSGAEWDQWSERARSRYESHFTGAQFQQRLFAAVFEA